MQKMIDILSWLDDDDIEWMAAHGQRFTADAGEVVVERGQRGVWFFVVLEGDLMVEKMTWEPLAELHPGDVIGELSLLDNGPASATVRAVDSVVLLGVPMDALMTRIETDDPFGKRLYWAIAEFLAGRMRRTMRHFTEPGGASADDTLCPVGSGRQDELMETLARAPLAGPLAAQSLSA